MKSRVLFSHRARRVFFFIHLWTGLLLGLWFALIGVTGSVLAWRTDLRGIEIARRHPIQKPSANAQMLSLSQAKAAIQKAYPDLSPRDLATITIPNKQMPFYAVTQGRALTYVIDPYTGQGHPPVQSRSLMVGQIQQFHQRLLAGGRGYLANGFLNFLAIPLLLSGLWLWWPTKLKHLKAHLTVKRGVSLKRTVYDLHNVMGIYLYGVLLVTTVTGAMLVQQHVSADGGIAAYLKEQDETAQRNAQSQGAPAAGSTPGRGEGRREGGREAGGRREGAGRGGAGGGRGRREPEVPKVTPQSEPISDDELVVLARQARPQFELARVRLPQRPDQAMMLTFLKPTGINLNETVFLDPYTGKEVAPPESAAAPTRSPLRQWTRLLHLGEFGGVLSKVIYTITGLLPLGLFITGFLLWWRKKRAKMQRARQATA